MTLVDMENAIADYFDVRKNIIVPNISWGMFDHECDMLIVRPSGYAVEVEIKRTRSDFLADFKKRHTHNDKRIKALYYAFPEELYEKCKDDVPDGAGILAIYKGKADFAFCHLKKAAINNESRPMTLEEMFTIAKLGTMRI